MKQTIITGENIPSEKDFSSFNELSWCINTLLKPASFHYPLQKKTCPSEANISSLHSNVYWFQLQCPSFIPWELNAGGETQHWTDFPQEAKVGWQADICINLHHIASLFYHAIPWNETSGKVPAFSIAVEEPSREWGKAWQHNKFNSLNCSSNYTYISCSKRIQMSYTPHVNICYRLTSNH